MAGEVEPALARFSVKLPPAILELIIRFTAERLPREVSNWLKVNDAPSLLAETVVFCVIVVGTALAPQAAKMLMPAMSVRIFFIFGILVG